ncbi:unnamed protein product [Effrenium voratum]|uniref:Uncharacterized protein n=1 Tax=Effrenium voratum TaxID=2562239 RepID=A0AA36HXR5_9DINO|nr:unnamed protein product [Effrenium voratum]CAJ1440462.1 unnamed protein product [Effrenium voratum]
MLAKLGWHARRSVEVLRHPIWQYCWRVVQEKSGGKEKFPACDEFLASSIDVYRHLQQELMAADHIGHLEDLFSEELWPIVRSAHSDFEPWRKRFGREQCGIHWTSTEAFIFTLQPPGPKRGAQKDEQIVVAGARLFSVISMTFAPEQERHSIDDLIFESAFDTDGVSQWRIIDISGPTTGDGP